jgi:hypothetical protein
MTNLLLGFSFIVCLVLIIFGFNRGFEISDEGFYMLLSVPAQANENGIINYDLFFKLFFQLTGHTFSLVEMRLLRLIGYFLAAFALTQFLKNRFEIPFRKPQLFLLSILGLFSGYAFLPPTLSYNSLTVVLSCFWLWNTFAAQSPTYAKSLILGFILALLVYVKVTVALILFLFSIGIWVKKNQFSFASLGLVFIPFLILELAFWVFLGEFASARLLSGIPLNSSRLGYGIIPMIKSPLVGFVFSAVALLMGWMIAKVKGQSFPVQFSVLVFTLGALFWMIRFTHITEEWNHVVLIATSGFLGFLWGNSKSEFTFSLEEMTLFSLPFLLHFGSNVYWMRIGIHYWVFWILLIFIYACPISKILLHSFVFLSVFLVFNGVWWHPFGQNDPLWVEKTKWMRNVNEVILLDQAQVRTIQKIEKWEKERGHEELLAAYQIPGVVWLVGGRIPFSPSFWEKEQLHSFFDNKPRAMIYYNLQDLPENWNFQQCLYLGHYEGNSLQLLWD